MEFASLNRFSSVTESGNTLLPVKKRSCTGKGSRGYTNAPFLTSFRESVTNPNDLTISLVVAKKPASPEAVENSAGKWVQSVYSLNPPSKGDLRKEARLT